MMGAGLPSGGHKALLFFLISFFITVAQGLKHFVINVNAFLMLAERCRAIKQANLK